MRLVDYILGPFCVSMLHANNQEGLNCHYGLSWILLAYHAALRTVAGICT